MTNVEVIRAWLEAEKGSTAMFFPVAELKFYQPVYQLIGIFSQTPEVLEAYRIPPPPGEDGEWVARKSDRNSDCYIFSKSGETWYSTVEEAKAEAAATLKEWHQKRLAALGIE